MKRVFQVSITLIILLSLFIPSGLSGVKKAEAADPVEFAVVTDYGTGTSAAPVASMINGWTPDFIVTAGDNYQLSSNADVYPTYVGNYYGPGAGTDWITPGNFYPVPGNHDYYAGGSETDRFYNYFNPFSYISFVEPYEAPYSAADDTLYYQFVRGPVHFFMLDTGVSDNVTPDSAAQLAWLDAALDASTSAWNIVMFHMPAASGGASHGSDTGIQWDFAGMGADFVISGHNHVYERISWKGITYFTAGAGGGNGRSDWNASNLPSGAVDEAHYAVLNSSGAMRVNATDTTISFEYITTNGTTETVQDEATYPEQAETCTTVSFQQGTAGYAGAADTQIRSGSATTNYGSTTPLLVDADDGSGVDVSALLYWDISGAGIPSNATIDSASVTLYIENATVSPGFQMYDMTQSWTEGGVTWNTYNGTNNWPGGAGGDGDRGTTSLATFLPTSTGSYTTNLNASGLAIIEGWISTPTTNNGFMINEGSTTDGMDFTSSEGTTLANRPKLTITYCQAADIGDFVWVDDGDGIQEAGEPGLEGVTVNLRDSSDNSLAMTTTTNASGLYGFYSVPTGNFYLEFVKPTGYIFTLKDQGVDDALDSDADTSTGRSDAFAWTEGGTSISTIDAGLKALKLGDRVWDDTDKDGIQDAGEPGLPGVIVRLYKLVDFDPYYQVVGSTYTDASGNYSFPTPEAGEYFIQFELPGSYTYSPKDQIADDLDSDVYMADGWTDFFTVTDSTSTLGIDAGMWQSFVTSETCTTVNLEAVADTYLYEGSTSSNYGNATTIEVRGSATSYPPSYTTDAYHPLIKWNLSSIPSNATVTNATITLRVGDTTYDDYYLYAMRRDWEEGTGVTNTGADWYDYNAAGNDWGSFGAQSTTSDRYNNNLWNVDVLAETGTRTSQLNASGIAVVQDWVDGSLANYGVTIQNYYQDGTADFASRENTSYAGPTLNVTYCVPTLTAGIGDEVWKDENENGLQDALGTTEFPGGGVTVKLWDVATDSVYQTTKSTYDNSYGFSGIPAGNYYIEFVLPAGYQYTTEYAGGATTPLGAGNDSDVNTVSGFTDQFNYNGTDPITNIDAGFKGGYSCYTIADGLAYDSDNNDSLIKVDLLTAKGTLINTSSVSGIEAGALEPETGRLYTFNTATWGYLAVSTGVWTIVGTSLQGDTCVDQDGTTRTVGGDGFDAVAYNPVDQTWWAAMRLTGTTLDVLVKINKDTGELDLNTSYFGGVTNATCTSIAAPAGNTTLTDIDDMAFDSSGTLYILANLSESEGRVVVPTVVAGEYTGAVTDLGSIWRADMDEEVTDIEGFSIDESGRVWITTGGWNVTTNVDHDTLFEILNLTGGETLIAVPHIQMSIANTLIGGALNINYTDFEAVTCYGTTSGQGDTRSSIGDTVWIDMGADTNNDNGILDIGETGINGVVVELWGRGPDGVFGTADDILLRTTTTGDNPETTGVTEVGWYLFDDLPAGVYQVRIAASNFATDAVLEGYTQSIVDPSGIDVNNYNQALPYTATLPWDTDVVTADFGFTSNPTAIVLPTNFQAYYATGNIEVSWDTDNEWDIVGFRLYRNIPAEESSQMVVETDAQYPKKIIGAHYSYLDVNTLAGVEYAYWLEVLLADGSTVMLDPVLIRSPFNLFLPLTNH